MKTTANTPKQWTTRIFLILANLISSVSFAIITCEESLVLHGLPHYIHSAREQSRDVLPPDFFNPALAREAALTWKGDIAPPILEAALPDGVRFIGHELFKNNEPGLVKSASNYVSVRAEVEHNGKIIGTNLGVTGRALLSNTRRTQKSLVSENAKAVMIFMHGGGTTTTGHHVGINARNALEPYGIEVISFDQLWHAGGPRETFRNARDYFEYVRAMIRKFVLPAGVPVFLGGHSMGGLFADLYMRLYPDDDLIKGLLALSPVPDLSPGKATIDKVKSEKYVDLLTPEQMARIAPSEKYLGDSLLKDGKVTPLYDLFVGHFFYENDWAIPHHHGENYLPALFVWGAGDWLYVGKEEIVKNHLAPLKNVQLEIFGPRPSVETYNHALRNGNSDVGTEIIGHLIFDHFSESVTDTTAADGAPIETYQIMRKFIERIVGHPLEKKPVATETSQDGLLLKFLETWATNLAFREYVRQSSVQLRAATPAMIELKEAATKTFELPKKIKAAQEAGKTAEAAAAELELAAAQAHLQERGLTTKDILNVLQLKHSFGDEAAAQTLRAREDLLKQQRETEQSLKKMRAELHQASAKHQKAQKEFRAYAKLLSTELPSNATQLAAHLGSLEATLKQMSELRKNYSEEIEAFRVESLTRGEVLDPASIPESIVAKATAFGAALKVYQQLNSEIDAVVQLEISRGVLGADAQRLVDHSAATRTEHDVLQRKIEEEELTASRLHARILDMDRDLILNGPYQKYFDVRLVRGADILKLANLKELLNDVAALQTFWTQWQRIYKEREVAGAESLY